jgi:hypothetical protein
MIEASCTVLLAISAMYVSWSFALEGEILMMIRFILPDYPHNTKWLNREEREIAVSRIQDKSGVKDMARGSLLRGLRLALTDYKVWLLS